VSYKRCVSIHRDIGFRAPRNDLSFSFLLSQCGLSYAAPGDYKIIAAMPDRDGDHICRIKSPLEEHERVVQESLLVKSEGSLPEKALNKSSTCGHGDCTEMASDRIL
jgi:hypothetical protein